MLMKPAPGTSSSPLLKKILFILSLWLASFSKVPAMELDSFPVESFSRDSLVFSFFREERSSFYWINIGVPDAFFKNVSQISAPPDPVAYQVRGMEYGLRVAGWWDDQFQTRITVPFEGNALVDSVDLGNPHNVTQLGDIEIGATYLLLGKREMGHFVGLDGWFRLPTGTNPFNLAFPLLSTGKGAPEEAVGLTAGQELGGFSFFQSIHYEKTQPIYVDSPTALLGQGTFQWPDNFRAMGRIEYLVFRRAQRFVSLFYELNLRISGSMEMNQQPVAYGQGQLTDRLLFSSLGLAVRVDKEFSVEGKGIYFPFEPVGIDKPRPDYGLMFSLSMQFRPF